MGLNYNLDQLHLIDIYRTFQSAAAYTFFNTYTNVKSVKTKKANVISKDV